MPPGSSTKKNSGLSNLSSLLQECFACGVLVIGARERIIACTAEAAAHLHTRAEQLRNAPLNSLPAPLFKLIRDAAKSGKPVMNRDIPLKISRGGTTTLRASILPVKTRALSQVVVVLNDLASAPIFKQNMRRLDQLANLDTLSASMAHEIKNGMVAIKTFFDLLAQKGEDAELTQVVNRELQRINGIVTQMLRLAAPKRAAFITVRVHDLLDHSLRLLQHHISSKSVSLQRHYKADPDTVHGDDAQLQQAFMNIFLNALEAMDSNGVLTVATETTEGPGGVQLLEIHIKDTGAGVAQENMDRLFEPFFTTKKNGTGLGLSISRLIAHEHRGTIQVRSEINKGSTFTLSLPVSSPL
ncbi:MAG: ATP-binding protein [Verrucomicrobiota bacterium]|jgi:signal transduction histidine kinase